MRSGRAHNLPTLFRDARHSPGAPGSGGKRVGVSSRLQASSSPNGPLALLRPRVHPHSILPPAASVSPPPLIGPASPRTLLSRRKSLVRPRLGGTPSPRQLDPPVPTAVEVSLAVTPCTHRGAITGRVLSEPTLRCWSPQGRVPSAGHASVMLEPAARRPSRGIRLLQHMSSSMSSRSPLSPSESLGSPRRFSQFATPHDEDAGSSRDLHLAEGVSLAPSSTSPATTGSLQPLQASTDVWPFQAGRERFLDDEDLASPDLGLSLNQVEHGVHGRSQSPSPRTLPPPFLSKHAQGSLKRCPSAPALPGTSNSGPMPSSGATGGSLEEGVGSSARDADPVTSISTFPGHWTKTPLEEVPAFAVSPTSSPAKDHAKLDPRAVFSDGRGRTKPLPADKEPISRKQASQLRELRRCLFIDVNSSGDLEAALQQVSAKVQRARFPRTRSSSEPRSSTLRGAASPVAPVVPGASSNNGHSNSLDLQRGSLLSTGKESRPARVTASSITSSSIGGEDRGAPPGVDREARTSNSCDGLVLEEGDSSAEQWPNAPEEDEEDMLCNMGSWSSQTKGRRPSQPFTPSPPLQSPRATGSESPVSPPQAEEVLGWRAASRGIGFDSADLAWAPEAQIWCCAALLHRHAGLPADLAERVVRRLRRAHLGLVDTQSDSRASSPQGLSAVVSDTGSQWLHAVNRLHAVCLILQDADPPALSSPRKSAAGGGSLVCLETKASVCLAALAREDQEATGPGLVWALLQPFLPVVRDALKSRGAVALAAVSSDQHLSHFREATQSLVFSSDLAPPPHALNELGRHLEVVVSAPARVRHAGGGQLSNDAASLWAKAVLAAAECSACARPWESLQRWTGTLLAGRRDDLAANRTSWTDLAWDNIGAILPILEVLSIASPRAGDLLVAARANAFRLGSGREGVR